MPAATLKRKLSSLVQVEATVWHDAAYAIGLAVSVFLHFYSFFWGQGVGTGRGLREERPRNFEVAAVHLHLFGFLPQAGLWQSDGSQDDVGGLASRFDVCVRCNRSVVLTVMALFCIALSFPISCARAARMVLACLAWHVLRSVPELPTPKPQAERRSHERHHVCTREVLN